MRHRTVSGTELWWLGNNAVILWRLSICKTRPNQLLQWRNWLYCA